jgi:hypothetical protein
MGKPEPGIVYPLPCKQIAHQDDGEAANHEYDEAKMGEQHYVRE